MRIVLLLLYITGLILMGSVLFVTFWAGQDFFQNKALLFSMFLSVLCITIGSVWDGLK